jgi:hypothetical protein
MAPPKINSVNEIDTSSFTFKVVDAKGAKGLKTVYMNSGGHPVFFQTPVSKVPFGVSCWDEAQAKYTLNLSVADPVFLDKIKEIEGRIIDEAFNDSQNWFKKKYASREVVEELFTSALRYSKDKVTGEISDKYPPTMKLNMQYVESGFTCEGYRKTIVKGEAPKIEPITVEKETIFAGSHVVAIVQCTGIWIINGKFGCTFRLVQVMLIDDGLGGKPTNRKITGYSFIEDSDDEL